MDIDALTAVGIETEDYKKFVDKFKPKKTTDDCYTPLKVYEAIKNWVVKTYDLQGKEIVRPFYPGGDYENYSYPDNCVVIDNPPFSILSKILAFYVEKKIDFFLFSPGLTLFSSNIDVNYIVARCDIRYANGARVNTNFTTNMGESKIWVCPELQQVVRNALKEELKNNVVKYCYPKNVVSSAILNRYSNAGIEIKIGKDECYFTRQLDHQKECGKTIFGAGYLVSDSVVNQLKLYFANGEYDYVWELSDREKNIISSLGGGENGERTN